MPHPMLHLAASRPLLLLEHAQAYAELVSAEAAAATTQWKRSALLGAAALVSLLVAVVLAGVSLLLLAVVPLSQMPSPWALWAVPLPPLLLALGCTVAGRNPAAAGAFSQMRRQLKADIAMLRETTAP